jgi:predicted dehydrogenase
MTKERTGGRARRVEQRMRIISGLRVALVGFGYWGSKLARNLREVPECELAMVCDANESHRRACSERYPEAQVCAGLDDALVDPAIDAVVLATPAAQHAEHAIAALRAGKHVFVEKPLALSVGDCDRVIAEADSRQRVLMVGHTFLYSEPVRYLRQLIQEGELGEILYIYGQRLNLGIIRQDLNALWNFAPHDISILLYLLGERPSRASARQFSVLDHELEDMAFLVLEFPSGVVGHLHDSWLDPRKIRQFTVVGSEKMVVYDDTELELPLRIYDKGVRQLPQTLTGSERSFSPDQGFGEFKLQVRAGDVVAPRIEPSEPLRKEVEHFVHCVQTGERPLTDGVHGRDVIEVLEAAERSSTQSGLAQTIGPRDRSIA